MSTAFSYAAADRGNSRACVRSIRPRRGTMLLLLLGCAFLAAPVTPTAPAAAAQQKVEERLVGAWRLVSVEGNSPMRKVDYQRPTGLIVYDRSGWMSVQIAIHGERKPFAKGVSNGTVEEKAEAFDTYLSITGPIPWTRLRQL